MFFSVITVVLNDLDNLKQTIENVKKQSCQDYEYIIVDGGSSDGTLEYLNKICQKDEKIRYISEKDGGIYNAMNKGISLARGEYILFLGAGDFLYHDKVFEEVKKYGKYDVIYGYGIFSSGERKGKRIGTKLGLWAFLWDKVAAHQAVYVKTIIMQKYKFQEKYKVQADQDALMRMYRAGYRFKYLNKPLCYYDGLGFSSRKEFLQQNILDRVSMLKAYYPVLYKIRVIGHWIITRKKYDIYDDL